MKLEKAAAQETTGRKIAVPLQLNRRQGYKQKEQQRVLALRKAD
jgi:hypothetical protein